jgi:hypothetical protein
MLAYEPKERLTAQDALNHEWITKNTSVKGVPQRMVRLSLENLQSFKVREV